MREVASRRESLKFFSSGPRHVSASAQTQQTTLVSMRNRPPTHTLCACAVLLATPPPARAGVLDAAKDFVKETMKDAVTKVKEGRARGGGDGGDLELTSYDKNTGPAHVGELRGERFFRCIACKQMITAIGDVMDFRERSAENFNEAIGGVCEDMEDTWTGWSNMRLDDDEIEQLNGACSTILTDGSKQRLTRKFLELAKKFDREIDSQAKGRMAFKPYVVEREGELCTYTVQRSCMNAKEMTDANFEEGKRQGLETIEVDEATGKRIFENGTMAYEFPEVEERREKIAAELKAQEDEKRAKYKEKIEKAKAKARAKAAAKAGKAEL